MTGKWIDLGDGKRVFVDTIDYDMGEINPAALEAAARAINGGVDPGPLKIETARLVIEAYEAHERVVVPECPTSDALLPCPFCGGPATEIFGLVGCEPCAIARRDAASWNRRAERCVHRPSAMDAEWCINMARQEGDAEIGAGALARDPEPLAKIAPGVVERLTCMGHAMPTCREAADTIRALQAERDQLAQTLAAIEEDGTVEHNAAVKLRQEVAELRLALAPFAKIEVPPDASDGTWVAKTIYCNDQVTASSVRKAKVAIRARGEG